MPASCSRGRDAIGDVALGDAVEGDRHAWPGEADLGRLELDGAVVHQRLRSGVLTLAWSARIGAGPREVRGVEAPERLHCDVEGALRPLRVGARLRQQRNQLQRRRREVAVPVEARDRALGPVEAEHVLQPVDLFDAARDQAARSGGVGIVKDDLCRSAECNAGPAVQMRCLGAGPDRREGQAGGGGRDGDEAAPGRRGSGPARHWWSPCAGIAGSSSSA